MVTITERETQSIAEMAQFRGFGISIEVRSNDHGKFGNKQLPAHAHILDNSGRELAQIELTERMPTSVNDIVWYKTPNPSSSLGTVILKLLKSKSQIAKKAGIRATVWQNMLNFWFAFHEQ